MDIKYWSFKEGEIIEIDYKKRRFRLIGAKSLSITEIVDLLFLYSSRMPSLN